MYNSSFRPKIALFFAATLIFQVCFPTISLALTSGPSQPEFSGFEPVGASNNVDLFSGDFTYNIPLFELPGPDGGYPFNLAYHSGVGMEQEASWVGLGWSLTPGSISRDVRGIPDDFNGEDQKVEQNTYVRPDVTVSGGVGVNLELFGAKFPEGTTPFQLGLGLDVAHNSYKGWSSGLNISPSAQIANFGFSNSIGLNSATGSSLSPSLSISQRLGKKGTSGTLSVGANFASGEGLSGLNLGISASAKRQKGEGKEAQTAKSDRFKSGGASAGASITYNDMGFTPAVTQPFRGVDLSAGVELGAFFGASAGGTIQASYSRQAPLANGKWQDFYPRGFFHHDSGEEGAGSKTLLDFTRENQGASRVQTPNLAFANMQPDVYSVSGQGTGGQFIPMRSSVPVVGDAIMQSSTVGGDLGLQLDPGGLGLLGGDVTVQTSKSSSKYYDHELRKALEENEEEGNIGLTESTYFRASGELSAPAQSLQGSRLNLINDDEPVTVKLSSTNYQYEPSPFTNDLSSGDINDYVDYSLIDREPRTQTLLPLKTGDLYPSPNQEARLPEFRTKHYDFVGNQNITEVDFSNSPNSGVLHGLSSELNLSERISTSKDLIAGFISTNADGARYNYGFPLWNFRKMEASFSVPHTADACGNTSIPKAQGSSIINNVKDISDGTNLRNVNAFKSVTETPPFAHSYLLTNILGPDYIDQTNDGLTIDDTGYWVNFTYGRISTFNSPYRWRAPYEDAAHSPGNRNDDRDDKGSFVYGEREQAILAEVSTKTHVARFYSSKRTDALGATSLGIKGQQPNTNTAGNFSYRLDSIELRTQASIISNSNEEPILTVLFKYEEDGLAQGTPNANYGPKLTLKEVSTVYRGNRRGTLSPYKFQYEEGQTTNIISANYNKYVKNGQDRWGNNILRPNDQGCATIDDPYVVQDIARMKNIYNDANESIPGNYDVQQETNAAVSAWHLNQITLPSGAEINVHYESDDYAYVQDRKAMQMVPIAGVTEVDQFNISTSNLDPNSEDLRVYFELERNNFDEEEYEPNSTDVRADVRNYLSGLHGVNRPLDEVSSALIGSQVLFKIESIFSKAAIESESITGYSEIRGYGKDEFNGKWYGYVDLAPVSLGKAGKKKNYHPFAAAAWQFIRTTYPNALQTNNFNSDASFIEMLEQLGRSFTTVVDLFRNYYATCSRKEIGSRIIAEKSYLRLCSPDGKKLGGGSRVKAIVIDDRWDHKEDKPLEDIQNSTGNDNAVRYGQVYDYSKIENGRRISSGVATNEPAIGFEECALQYSKSYTDEAIFRSDQQYSIEYPVNKSVLPGASIGYSEITVRSLAGEALKFSNENPGAVYPNYLSGFEKFKDHAIATSGETVTEYFTARDYPIITKETQIDKSTPITSVINALLYKEVNTSFNGAQGYSTIINDMHGKMRATSHYALSNSGSRGERINETRYTYFSKESAHTVANQIVPTKEVVSAVPSVKFNTNGTGIEGPKVDLGVSHSMTWDMRHNKLVAVDGTVQANAWALAIFPGVMVLPSAALRHGDTKTIVSNKVVRRSGILSHVQVTDGQSRQITRNHAFDPLTGRAALTTVTNSFDEEVYALDIPAYTQYPGMGPAYENQGVSLVFQEINENGSDLCDLQEFQAFIHGSGTPVADPSEYLTAGDEILLTDVIFGSPSPEVEAAGRITVGRVEPNSVWLETPMKNTSITLGSETLAFLGLTVRSGQRNQLSPSAGAIQSFTNPLDNFGEVLSNAANTYSEFGADRTFDISEAPQTCYSATHEIYPYPDDVSLPVTSCEDFDPDGEIYKISVEFREQLPTNQWTGWDPVEDFEDVYTYYINNDCVDAFAEFYIQRPSAGHKYQIRTLFYDIDGNEFGSPQRSWSCETEDNGSPIIHLIDIPTTECDSIQEAYPYNLSRPESLVSIENSSIDFAVGISNNEITAPRFTDGERGIWRPHQSFVYVADRKSLRETEKPLAPNEELNLTTELKRIGVFLDENGTVDNKVSSFDHRIPMANLTNRQTDEGTSKYGWRLVEESTAYGNVKANGEATESRDALGVYSSAQYGYDGYLAEAVANNARRTEIGAESFENFDVNSPVNSEGNLFFGKTNSENPVHTWSETYNIVAPYNPSWETPGIIIDYTDFAERSHITPVAASVSLTRNPDNNGCNPNRSPAEHSDAEKYYGYLSDASLSTYSPSPTETVVPYETDLAILNGNISNCFEEIPNECWWGQVTLYYNTNESSSEQQPKVVDYSHSGRRAIEMSQNCEGAVAFPQNRLALSAGKKYLASAWVRTIPNESGQSNLNPIEELIATENVFSVSNASILRTNADEQLIEGWRRIEIIFEAGQAPISLDLTCGIAYDDVRVFPVDGSLQSYVYDPIDYKLRATLDENNFATFYQYDDQGILIGTLKETERGIRTIQETRSFTNKNVEP